MRSLVVGLGVQGQKRKRFAGADFVGAVDPVRPDAEYRHIRDVPMDSFDAALVCTPDEPKTELLHTLLSNGKHVLVEKPLWATDDAQIDELQRIALMSGVYCYTAYNHRFEPHFVALKALIDSGQLGKIYRCRMFYGNGTARLVRESDWRDKGAGVLPDLGSHLLDTVRFWFGDVTQNLNVVSSSCFENRAPDHVVVTCDQSSPKLELEMTLLMWKNHFTCDLLAEKGSAHIESLCKWGPSTLTVRTRVLPSGRPSEDAITLVKDDPTWALEYNYFRAGCLSGRRTDLAVDRWLNQSLRSLSVDAVRGPQ